MMLNTSLRNLLVNPARTMLSAAICRALCEFPSLEPMCQAPPRAVLFGVAKADLNRRGGNRVRSIELALRLDARHSTSIAVAL